MPLRSLRTLHASAALAVIASVFVSPVAFAQDEPEKEQPATTKPAETKSEPQFETREEAVKAEGGKPSAPVPTDEPVTAVIGPLKINPFVSLVGGIKTDVPLNGPDEHKEARISAIALSRFGLRGQAGAWVSFESELMASGGTSLHGSSTYEGQAALQVRNQLVRLSIDRWMAEVGRVTDEASLDFYSAHVGDVFLQDTATRDPLLYSGFNLGNGVRGTVRIAEGLRLGLAFTAGNPVSSTGSLWVGGTFPPFGRVYEQPYQAIGKAANSFPDDTFHMMMLTPSALLRTKWVDANAAFQGITIDTDTTKTDDQTIRGFNLRGNVRVKLLDEMLVPFLNFAYAKNDTVDPANVARLAPDKYTGIVAGGGVDFNYAKPFDCKMGCVNGIGAQYTQVQYQVGDGAVTRLHYLNLGTSYWLTDHLALGLRLAAWIQVQNGPPDEGERSLLATMRFVM